jgi:competence protein ComEC
MKMHPHFLFIALLIGALAGVSLTLGPWFHYRGLFLFVLAIGLSASVLWRMRSLMLVVSFIIGFCGALIVASQSVAEWNQENQSEAPLIENIPVSVSHFPQMKRAYQEVRLKQECTETDCDKQILWQAPLSKELRAGDRFTFTCKLEWVENFSDEFDYRMYLAKEGVGFLCREGTLGQALEPHRGGRMMRKVEGARLWTEATLARALPQPELGLANGLILGGGQYLSESVELDFKRIGMTHIVAVSGYNILLVAAACFYFFSHLGLWRRQKILLGSAGVWLFILFVGAPASAVRAGCMALIFFLALASGRKSSGFAVLLVSAFLMLAHNPLLLYHDIGFQLSFMALVGILFSATSYKSKQDNIRERFLQVVRTTLWVEAFILPLIMYHFGVFTWFSIVANIILLPLVPLAMLGTFALLPLSLILPSTILSIAAMPVYGLLWFLIRFALYFSSYAFVAVEGMYFSFSWLMFWYAGLLAFGVLQLRRNKKEWYAKAFMVDSQ